MQSLFRFTCVGLHNRFVVPRFAALFEVQSAGFKLSPNLLDNVPERPRRPPSSFMLYLKDIKPTLEKENPNSHHTDIVKKASERWKEENETTKETYVAKFREGMQNYVALNGAYQKYLEDHADVADSICAEKNSRMEKRRKRNLKKLYKLTERPSKPPSAFGLFILERKSSRGDTVLKEWMKDLGAVWRGLPGPEKDSYMKRASDLTKQYRQNLTQWYQSVLDSEDEAAVLLKEQLNKVKVVNIVPSVKKISQKSKKVSAKTEEDDSENSQNTKKLKKQDSSENSQKSKQVSQKEREDTSEKHS